MSGFGNIEMSCLSAHPVVVTPHKNPSLSGIISRPLRIKFGPLGLFNCKVRAIENCATVKFGPSGHTIVFL